MTEPLCSGPKPYVDGAVRELTSGEDRSPKELRRAVEQLMISAGDRNADVRATIHAGHTDQTNIRINADIDQTDELLKRIRRDPEQYQEQ